MKPWLLLTGEERQARIEVYQYYITHTLVVDEVLLTMLRPPQNRLSALLELFIYQSRKK